jgi:hypothetical protein
MRNPLMIGALLCGCRSEYTLGTINDVRYEGEARWGFTNLRGSEELFISRESEDLACYYQYEYEGSREKDPDICPTCVVTFRAHITSMRLVRGSSACPSSREVVSNEQMFLGVAASEQAPDSISCRSVEHIDVDEVMEDPERVEELEQFIFLGATREGSRLVDGDWDSSCYIRGALSLSVDKHTGDLHGSYSVDYSHENWDFVDVSGAFRADQILQE